LGLPEIVLAPSVVGPQMTAPTFPERLDRLVAEFDRNRVDLHLPGAVLAIVCGEEVIVDEGRMQWDDPVEKYISELKLKVRSNDPNGRMNFQVDRVEVSVKLAPDTFTLQHSIGSGQGK
jgi:hypothetical protein